MAVSYLWSVEQTHTHQPMTSDKASFKNTDVKMRSWVLVYGSSSGLYIYYNYTQP